MPNWYQDGFRDFSRVPTQLKQVFVGNIRVLEKKDCFLPSISTSLDGLVVFSHQPFLSNRSKWFWHQVAEMSPPYASRSTSMLLCLRKNYAWFSKSPPKIMHIGWEGNSPLTPRPGWSYTVFEGLHPWNWKSVWFQADRMYNIGRHGF